MKMISEGKARIYTGDGVFYNPKMSQLRDISVLFLKAVSARKSRVLDSTAATGVRAIRYSLEAGAKDVTLLEINRKAYNYAKRNARLNKLKLKIINTSIQEFANTHRGSFDVVDLDPFGSPAPNIFDIMKLSWDGTILMITATDTAVLCGAHEGACVKIYGSKPLHNEMCKEAGIRILLSYTAKVASQFNFGIVPLLSISDMHYMRIFLRLEFGAQKAIDSVKTTGLGTFCRKCYSFTFARGVAPSIQQTCSKCGSRMEAFGPLWLGRLYEKEMIKKMLGKKSIPLLNTIYEELDVPMFYSIPKVTKNIGISSVSHHKAIEKLRKMGRIATLTQFEDEAIKTDATTQEVIKAVRSLKQRT